MRHTMYILFIMGMTFHIGKKKRPENNNKGAIFVSPIYRSLLQNCQENT